MYIISLQSKEQEKKKKTEEGIKEKGKKSPFKEIGTKFSNPGEIQKWFRQNVKQ